MDAITSNYSTNLENVGTGLQMFIIGPELINMAFLLLGIYGMYRGIEIQHPLYAILFCNLIVPLISTIINTTVFIHIRDIIKTGSIKLPDSHPAFDCQLVNFYEIFG